MSGADWDWAVLAGLWVGYVTAPLAAYGLLTAWDWLSAKLWPRPVVKIDTRQFSPLLKERYRDV